MRVSFVLDDIAGEEYQAEIRSIAKTYFKDGTEISVSFAGAIVDDGGPQSGTFIRYEDGSDEIIFD